jgi:SpoVK/Ycf46/Vps4 family AAA+-type ATPase
MQEKKEDVVLIFTANSVQSLPPELLRSGRIDAIFWVDLPDAIQRTEILKIHLRKVKRNPELFNSEELERIITACDGYTGAEIECWVQEALKYGFKKGHKPNPTASDFLETVKNVTPIVRLMKDDIDASRKWAKDHGARNASIVRENVTKSTPTKPRRVQSEYPPGPVAAS